MMLAIERVHAPILKIENCEKLRLLKIQILQIPPKKYQNLF